MTVTVEQVVLLAELDLRLATHTPSLDRPLRWVAVSEQQDPTPWIESGDLVLTTGMAMTSDASECRAYVERLVRADAAGLGFGVGLHHAQVPAALVAAGEELGLPVIIVPEPLPFVAVSRAVSRLLSAEEYAESGHPSTASAR
jgi:PucR family transcriptional regulator, purine catabolism regulatory protein